MYSILLDPFSYLRVGYQDSEFTNSSVILRKLYITTNYGIKKLIQIGGRLVQFLQYSVSELICYIKNMDMTIWYSLESQLAIPE